MSYTLGIDIGTYRSKGVLVDGEGKIVTSALKPHRMRVPQSGWAEHDAEADWWGDFVHIARAILAESRIDPREIKAIGCSAIGACMLPVDINGAPLMNATLYGIDTRASAEVEELTNRIGLDRLIATGGNALTSQAVGPKILWLRRNHPEIYSKMKKIVSATSYIVQKLTGVWVVDHYTAANFGPLYLINERSWDTAPAVEIVDPSLLPDIRWTTEIAGEVSQIAAAETGLAAGTPVTCGTIDAAAEAISVGVMNPGEMMMMYGSTICIIMPTTARIADSRLWYAPWVFEGEHASMAALATSGTLTHWFRDQLARDLPVEDAFAALAAESMESPPGANGLVVLPYFSGERTPIHDPLAKGVVFGLDLTHTRSDIYRAFLEGIAFGTRHVFDTWRESGYAPDRIFAVGGGTQNATWLQATSDITGVPQILRNVTIGASYGDAFLAALAIGAGSPHDIDLWNPKTAEILPDKRNAGVYAHRYATFRALYERSKDLMANSQ